MKYHIAIGYLLLTSVLTIKTLYKEPVTTREGSLFVVKLTSAPSTGFDWFFGNERELHDYVRLVKTEFVSRPSLVTGRIGKKIFTFKALKASKIKIRLVKRKMWQEDEADHAIINVTIKKSDMKQTPYLLNKYRGTKTY